MFQYVYFLYGKDDELLYVGQTNSLKSRIGAHLINHEWSEEIAKAKYIEFLGDKNTAQAVEGILIWKMSPKYNRRGAGYVYFTDKVIESLDALYGDKFKLNKLMKTFDIETELNQNKRSRK